MIKQNDGVCDQTEESEEDYAFHLDFSEEDDTDCTTDIFPNQMNSVWDAKDALWTTYDARREALTEHTRWQKSTSWFVRYKNVFGLIVACPYRYVFFLNGDIAGAYRTRTQAPNSLPREVQAWAQEQMLEAAEAADPNPELKRLREELDATYGEAIVKDVEETRAEIEKQAAWALGAAETLRTLKVVWTPEATAQVSSLRNSIGYHEKCRRYGHVSE